MTTDELTPEQEAAWQAIAYELLTDAKTTAPVDTGYLRDKIRAGVAAADHPRCRCSPVGDAAEKSGAGSSLREHTANVGAMKAGRGAPDADPNEDAFTGPVTYTDNTDGAGDAPSRVERDDPQTGDEGRSGPYVYCPKCGWGTDFEPTGDVPWRCRECGEKVEQKIEYSNPDTTLSDKQ